MEVIWIGLCSTTTTNSGNYMRKALRRFAMLSCLACASAVAPAQTKPIFEVASIKPAAPLDRATLLAAVQKRRDAEARRASGWD